MEAVRASTTSGMIRSHYQWNLRDHAITSQLGLERFYDEFNEVGWVLQPDGTCWVNVGDS